MFTRRKYDQRRSYQPKRRLFRQRYQRQYIQRPIGRPPSKYFRFTESPLMVNSDGQVRLLTSYPMGNSEYQRSSNSTLTYGVYIRLASAINGEILTIPQELYVHHWFVTDKTPGNAYPTAGDIFEGASPWLYHVKHDLKRRFMVKKRMTQRIFSVGAQSQTTLIGPAAHAVDGLTTMWKTRVRTNWKNNATGVLADIETGALLWVCVVSSSLPAQTIGWTRVNVYADCTLYFHCI